MTNMVHSRRQSLSSSWIESHGGLWMDPDTRRMRSQSPVVQVSSPGPGLSGAGSLAPLMTPVKEDVDAWVKEWEGILARDLIDSRIVTVDAGDSVEDACEKLLKEDIPCLAVTSPSPCFSSASNTALSYDGLFDFSDVNAFLTLAATRHNLDLSPTPPSSASGPLSSPAQAPSSIAASSSTSSSSSASEEDRKVLESTLQARTRERANEIVEAAKAGKVPVGLVSNFSQKNPLESVPHDSTIIDLLRLFSRGVHRALISHPSNPSDDSSDTPNTTANTADQGDTGYAGFISDRALLSYFSTYASNTPSFLAYLNNTLHALHLSSPSSFSSPILTASSLPANDQNQTEQSQIQQGIQQQGQHGQERQTPLLPSLYIYTSVIAASADQPVLDAMRLMSEEGVSSVAVVSGDACGENLGLNMRGSGEGGLVSAVSVTDVGKIVVPSESKQILYMPLQQFVALIKEPEGSTDGEETYPVYSLSPSSRLSYAIDKLLATDSHRLFITEEPRPPSNSASPVISPIGLGGHPASPGLGMGMAGMGRGAGNRLSGVVSVVDILTVFAHLAQLPPSDIDPGRQKRQRRISSTSTASSGPNSISSSPSHSMPGSLSSSFTAASGFGMGESTHLDLLGLRHGLAHPHATSTVSPVSPVLGPLGLGVGVVSSPLGLGRSSSRSSLGGARATISAAVGPGSHVPHGSSGSKRISGSFVLPGPIVANVSSGAGTGLGGGADVVRSGGTGAGGAGGRSRREGGGRHSIIGIEGIGDGVGGLKLDGEGKEV